VQIESGSVIGPDTIIYNNSLISENTKIMNSVLFENVYVSSNCFVDGSVCCDNASIKRNTTLP
jgi:NDP-sugar pyrophosphorylase family protein